MIHLLIFRIFPNESEPFEMKTSTLALVQCTFRIVNGEYKNLFSYCGGGGYILSRDLVEKISSLPEEDIKLNTLNISLIPEDGYTGWLVAEVKRKFNISKTLPVKSRNIVNKRRYEAKTGRYRFNRWFYHWLKSVRSFLRAE